MQSKPSTTSIVKPEGSSGGASRTSSIGQWHPVPFEFELPEFGSRLDLGWTSEPSGVSAPSVWGTYDERFPTTWITVKSKTGEPYEVEACRVRAICQVLVDRLPTVALPELVESLGQMFRFYRDRL